MKRTFERISFMLIGAVIAFSAYMLGHFGNSTDAQEDLKVGTYDLLQVKQGILFGETRDKDSPVGLIFASKDDDIVSISLGVNTGTGSIAKEENSIVISLGKDRPPIINLEDKAGKYKTLTTIDAADTSKTEK